MKTTPDPLAGKSRFYNQKDLHIRYLTRITGSSRSEIETLIKLYGVTTDAIIAYLENLNNRKSASIESRIIPAARYHKF